MRFITTALFLIVVPTLAWAQSVFPVRIDRGVAPTMTSEQVAAKVISRLNKPIEDLRIADTSGRVAAYPTPPAIESMDCVQGSDIARVIPTRFGPRPEPVVWVVQAQGEFAKTNPAGANIRKTRGYVLIDDATGQIVGMGSLKPVPAP